MRIPPAEIQFAAHSGYSELPVGNEHQMTHEINQENAERWLQENPANDPVEHNWEHVVMALEAHQAEQDATELSRVREILHKPQETISAVGSTLTQSRVLAAELIDEGALRALEAADSIDSTIERAQLEFTIPLIKKTVSYERPLTWSGKWFKSARKAVRDAGAARQNTPALRFTSGSLRLASKILAPIGKVLKTNSFDRTLPN